MKKLSKPLTDATLRMAKKGDIHREGGLEFRFFADGKAGIRYIGRLAGTNARLSLPLGKYPSMSLKAARVAGDKARADCRQGIDPRHAIMATAKAQGQLLGPLLEEYLASRVGDRATTRKDKTNTLRAALDGLKKRPIGYVTQGEIARLLDTYNDRPATKRKLYLYLNHFFEWAVERELLENNPCYRLRPPKPVPPRDRILSDREIASLMRVSGYTWGTMLKIALLTGQRGIEICKMRKSEINLSARTWTIPRETMKQGQVHVVPLSQAATNIIATELEYLPHGWGEYIFGSGSSGKRPFNGRSKSMERVLRLTGTSKWSGHTCRHTAVTMMQRLQISEEVRRAVTGHGKRRSGASAYEHYGYSNEARDAVERLAEEVAKICFLSCSDFSSSNE